MIRKRFIDAATAAAFASVALNAGSPAAASTTASSPARTLRAAFVMSEGANVMDIAGPWETFQDVVLADGTEPFALFTVSDATDPVICTGGLRITPSFRFENAPRPNVVVIGAQRGHSVAMMNFVRQANAQGALVLSVCTGAFKLAMTGLLDGKRATTHHEFYDKFAQQFPTVTLVRGERFVDDGSIVTAGGLTSGIQGALHVVSRLFTGADAENAARYMEFVPTRRPS